MVRFAGAVRADGGWCEVRRRVDVLLANEFFVAELLGWGWRLVDLLFVFVDRLLICWNVSKAELSVLV